MSNLSLDAIYYAINSLERECNFRWNVGGRDNLDRYRDLQRIMKDAMAEYRLLSEAMPRLRELKSAADREYDRYVTRFEDREPECCSCHISAPCGFCTRETKDEAA